MPIPHEEENEAAKFLRLFNASLFVNGCDPEFVCGPFQLLTECVEGDDEINPLPLNFPREVSEWAFIKEYVIVIYFSFNVIEFIVVLLYFGFYFIK